MYTVIQAVHLLLYIVVKCNFFSVVTWKDTIKYLQICEGVYSLLWGTVYWNSSLSLRRHAHGPLAERQIHTAHKKGNSSEVLKSVIWLVEFYSISERCYFSFGQSLANKSCYGVQTFCCLFEDMAIQDYWSSAFWQDLSPFFTQSKQKYFVQPTFAIKTLLWPITFCFHHYK